MRKRGILKIFAIIAVFLIITIISVLIFTPKAKELSLIKEPDCSLESLVIENITCFENNLGVNFTISRGENPLGIGSLLINITGRDNETSLISIAKINSSESRKISANVLAGDKISIFAEIRINKNNQTLSCSAIKESYECRKNADVNITEKESISFIPPPAGKISGTSIKDDNGAYYCDNNTDPKHRIKLYTYNIINGSKILSESYLESNKLSNICSNYPGIERMRYNLQWTWAPVEGIAGYKIYQYYSLNDTGRNYDYSLILGNTSYMLLDDSFEIWVYEGNETGL